MPRLSFARASAVLGVLMLAVPAAAQTWTGAVNGQWNNGANWSSNPAVPASDTDTTLTFDVSSVTGLTNNLAPNPFLLNLLTFTSGAPAYSIGGNGLDFRLTSFSAAPQIAMQSANAITLATPLSLTASLTVTGAGAGQLNLTGAITGNGGLSLSATGPIVLGSGANTFAGDVVVTSGILVLGNGQAIPAGRNVTVGAAFGTPATFSTAGLSNSAATALGLLTLNSSTFRVPSGSGDYYINQLSMDPQAFTK